MILLRTQLWKDLVTCVQRRVFKRTKSGAPLGLWHPVKQPSTLGTGKTSSSVERKCFWCLWQQHQTPEWNIQALLQFLVVLSKCGITNKTFWLTLQRRRTSAPLVPARYIFFFFFLSLFTLTCPLVQILMWHQDLNSFPDLLRSKMMLYFFKTLYDEPNT